MNKKKCASLVMLCLALVSCSSQPSSSKSTTSSVNSSISMSNEQKESSSEMEKRELSIQNVNQYLGFAPTKIKAFYDKVEDKNPSLYYFIIDESICDIQDNKVIGKSIGETTVIASDINGVEATFIVRINDPQEYRFYRDVLSVKESFELAGEPQNTTLFVGDSFFDKNNFWRSFNDDFTPQQNCFSAGISSSKASDWMQFRNILIDDLNPKNIVVHIGTNDINDTNLPYTAEEYYEIITEFLSAICDEHPNSQIYYFGIENRSDPGYAVKNVYCENVTSRISEEFSKQHSNFNYIDSPTVFNSSQNDYISADGIHPSKKGYAYYVEELNKLVSF